PCDELRAAAGSPALRDPRTLAALALAARSDILAEWRRPSEPEREAAPRQVGERRVRLSDFALRPPILDVDRPGPEHFLNGDLSLIEFNGRVLELAEDPSVPLLARIRFLSILSANLDEFFMVRVGGSTGGPAPLLHGGSVSLDHAAGHDPRAWPPLPTHSQLAPLPRHRGARRAGRTDALCLPEGAGDAPPLSDARGRERLRRGG